MTIAQVLMGSHFYGFLAVKTNQLDRRSRALCERVD